MSEGALLPSDDVITLALALLTEWADDGAAAGPDALSGEEAGGRLAEGHPGVQLAHLDDGVGR